MQVAASCHAIAIAIGHMHSSAIDTEYEVGRYLIYIRVFLHLQSPRITSWSTFVGLLYEYEYLYLSE